MNTNINSIRTEFHTFIDKIKDVDLLRNYYLTLQILDANTKKGGSWDKLTQAQKEEIMQGYEESENPENLTAHEDMVKKYPKWFSK